MVDYDKQLEDEVPEFRKSQEKVEKGSSLDVSSTFSAIKVRGAKEIIGIVLLAVVVLGVWEILLRVLHVPQFVFPTPSAIALALVKSFPFIWYHFLYTLGELISGYAIGATLGLLLAAVLTQIPYLEKIVTPYILILVTTPTIALVPLLMLQMGFTIWPRIIAIALAAGPMVLINATTGFRRTDLPKIALAKSYGASTSQIFLKIRFPLALPMINVGLLVGAIFGLITAVASDMFGGKVGLGNRLSYYASLARMDNFFAIVFLISLTGISIWIILSSLGNKWSSWKE
jgi:NitT/TauT family transport system permease protein